MRSEKPPPGCCGDIKQAFHCGVLAASFGSWHPERQHREGQESKRVGGGDGVNDSEEARQSRATGLAPSCGMSSCRETGTTWSRGRRQASRRSWLWGASFSWGARTTNHSTGPAASFPTRGQAAPQLFPCFFRDIPRLRRLQDTVPGLTNIRAPAWPNPLSPQGSLSRVPLAEWDEMLNGQISFRGARQLPTPLPPATVPPSSPCSSRTLLASPPHISSLSQRVWP